MAPPRTTMSKLRGRRYEAQAQNRRLEETSHELELVRELSDGLETGLNAEALQAILDLLKRGEQPEAIVAVVTSLAR